MINSDGVVKMYATAFLLRYLLCAISLFSSRFRDLYLKKKHGGYSSISIAPRYSKIDCYFSTFAISL
jgi:hypothetical protein